MVVRAGLGKMSLARRTRRYEWMCFLMLQDVFFFGIRFVLREYLRVAVGETYWDSIKLESYNFLVIQIVSFIRFYNALIPRSFHLLSSRSTPSHLVPAPLSRQEDPTRPPPTLARIPRPPIPIRTTSQCGRKAESQVTRRANGFAVNVSTFHVSAS